MEIPGESLQSLNTQCMEGGGSDRNMSSSHGGEEKREGGTIFFIAPGIFQVSPLPGLPHSIKNQLPKVLKISNILWFTHFFLFFSFLNILVACILQDTSGFYSRLLIWQDQSISLDHLRLPVLPTVQQHGGFCLHTPTTQVMRVEVAIYSIYT